MKYIFSAGLILVGMAACKGEKHVSLSDYVNPFIGTSASLNPQGVDHGLGKTYPGATTPFGLVQVSPNTITGRDKASGYSDEHKTIEGFAMTQMSGVGWFGDLGNFLVMPTTGPLRKIAGKEDGSIEGYRSVYDKATQTAKAGYYSVNLTDYDIRVETSATPHAGIIRFTYPENERSRIQIDLARRIAGTSNEQYIKVVDENTIEGWMLCTPEGGGWGNGKGQALYTVHFYAQLSKPMTDYGFWSADIPDDWSRMRDDVISIPYLQRVTEAPVITDVDELQGRHLGFYTDFPTRAGEEVVLKVGISFVDIEGARKNFLAEIADKDFDQVSKEAKELWDKELSRIVIGGGTEDDKTVFYTAMYHSMIDPRDYTDVDGRYVGGDYRIHEKNENFTKRTIFSGWDVFRSQFPLQTIINPPLVEDMINSLVTLAEESGKEYYERWEFLNAYSGCMIGNPAISVLADAYMKGIRGYDVEKAYRIAKNTSAEFGNDKLGFSWDARSRGISLTLEYAYFDWCIAQMAKEMGDNEDYESFMRKSKAYANLWDGVELGWFRPRQENGEWDPIRPKGRLQQGWGCTESNPYQQGWFVPHDIEGMVELMGGREKTLADLTDFFDKAPSADFRWNDYYNHSNEPVHQAPFFFNRLDAPWLTQKWTRIICANAYKNEIMGLAGNEDVGQMSAWYILAASGIHPACPGETRMEITSPVFDRITFKLDKNYFKGDEFTVVAHNNGPENIYIRKAKLNGKEWNKCHIDFRDIVDGGKLELWMGDSPNENWGLEK